MKSKKNAFGARKTFHQARGHDHDKATFPTGYNFKLQEKNPPANNLNFKDLTLCWYCCDSATHHAGLRDVCSRCCDVLSICDGLSSFGLGVK